MFKIKLNNNGIHCRYNIIIKSGIIITDAFCFLGPLSVLWIKVSQQVTLRLHECCESTHMYISWLLLGVLIYLLYIIIIKCCLSPYVLGRYLRKSVNGDISLFLFVCAPNLRYALTNLFWYWWCTTHLEFRLFHSIQN